MPGKPDLPHAPFAQAGSQFVIAQFAEYRADCEKLCDQISVRRISPKQVFAVEGLARFLRVFDQRSDQLTRGLAPRRLFEITNKGFDLGSLAAA